MNSMKLIYFAIDAINEKVGRFTSWITALVVCVVFVDVVMRYMFNTSFVFTQELEWHLFAFIFLLGAGYTLKKDSHVRVDIIYQHLSKKHKALINLFGLFLFLIPGCLMIIITSFDFMADAFSSMESSPDPGGIPFRFLLKACIPLGFILVFLQGVNMGIRSFFVLLGIEETLERKPL